MDTAKPFAYLAGYIDGDGTFNLQVSKRTRFKNGKVYRSEEKLCQICITGKQLDCLKYLQKHFGGSILLYKKVPKQSLIYSLRISIPMKNWLCSLSPFLIEKRVQCTIAMHFKQSTSTAPKLIEKLKKVRKLGKPSATYKTEILPFRNTVKPSISDFQYLAGFIDAECCIIINKKWGRKAYTYYAKLRCGNTKTPTISWMMKRFGGNVFYVSRNHIPNHNDLIDYHLGGKNLISVLKQTEPFLIHKKHQCLNAIHLLELNEKRVNPNSPMFKEWKSFSDPIKENIYQNVKSLNKRGS